MRLKFEIAVEAVYITCLHSKKILKLITQCKKREYRSRHYRGCVWLDDPGVVSLQGQEISVLYRTLRRVLEPIQRVTLFSPEGKFALTPSWSLHLMPSLRMSGAVPLLPVYAFMESTGPNLTFYLFYYTTHFCAS
jgi:hypothetical protein